MATAYDATQMSNPYAQQLPERALGGAQGNYMATGQVDNSLMGTTSYMPESLNYDPTLSYSARNQQQQAAAGLDNSNAYFQNLMVNGAPSVAQQQTQQGIAQANAQGMQAASASRGVDRAAAMRTAQQNAANLAGQAAITGGIQRMQERQQQQQFGAQGYMQGTGAQMGAYGQMRGADIQEQQGQEALQNQQNQQFVSLAQSNAANSQRGTGAIIGGIGSMLGGMMSDINAKENIHPMGYPEGGYDNVGAIGPYEKQTTLGLMKGGSYGPYAQHGATGDGYSDDNVNSSPPFGKLFGNDPDPDAAQPGQQQDQNGPPRGFNPFANFYTMSDERTKEGIHPLDGVRPYAYNYKDSTAHQMASNAANEAYARTFVDAKTPREGVMAQDLQRDPRTAPMVHPSPGGMLEIDGKRALSFLMGSHADLNERLARLEGGNGRY